MRTIDPAPMRSEQYSKKRPHPDTENIHPNEPLVVVDLAEVGKTTSTGNKRGKKKPVIPLLTQSQMWMTKKDDKQLTESITEQPNKERLEREKNKRPLYERKYSRQVSKNHPPSSETHTEQILQSPSSIPQEEDVYVAIDSGEDSLKQITPA